MSIIQGEPVALDTNVYIYAIRRVEGEEASVELFREYLPKLNVFLPFQVYRELQINLTRDQLAEILDKTRGQLTFTHGFVPAPPRYVVKYQRAGLKKGDILIASQLEYAGVKLLISENRHFLSENSDLPFRVISAAEALEMLL